MFIASMVGPGCGRPSLSRQSQINICDSGGQDWVHSGVWPLTNQVTTSTTHKDRLGWQRTAPTRHWSSASMPTVAAVPPRPPTASPHRSQRRYVLPTTPDRSRRHASPFPRVLQWKWLTPIGGRLSVIPAGQYTKTNRIMLFDHQKIGLLCRN